MAEYQLVLLLAAFVSCGQLLEALDHFDSCGQLLEAADSFDCKSMFSSSESWNKLSSYFTAKTSGIHFFYKPKKLSILLTAVCSFDS